MWKGGFLENFAPTYTITGQQSCCSEESHCCSLNCVCVCICVCPGCCLFWLNNFRKTQVNHTLPVFQLVAFSLEPKWVDPLCSIPGYTGVHTFYTGVTNRANHTLVIPFLFPLCLRQCCLARLHCLHVSRRLHPQQLHQEGPDGGTQAHLRPQRLQL